MTTNTLLKTADNCEGEKKPMDAEMSNPDKKIFAKYTKKELVNYYDSISSLMLPHLMNRPLSLYRFPNGFDKKGFYQKNRPEHFPGWINHEVIKKKEGEVDYIICNKKESLVFIASQIAEFHIWTSRTEKLYYPDRMIFDLDPSKEDVKALKRLAKKLGKLLSDIDLTPHIMTTGKRGYHIVVPIIPEQDNDAVRSFALKIAQVLENDDLKDVTTQLAKDKREDKMFIDVNRNSADQTAIAPYSVRAVKDATIALPISWDELKKTNPADYDINKVLKRIEKTDDPWKGFFSKQASLKKTISRLKK